MSALQGAYRPPGDEAPRKEEWHSARREWRYGAKVFAGWTIGASGGLTPGCFPVSGMINWHTMSKLKVAITLDAELLDQVDTLVRERRFPSRSQAIETALAEKLERLGRARLARECAKLDPAEERRFAEEGLAEDLRSWPAY